MSNGQIAGKTLLTVGVVQMSNELHLERNRDKMIRLLIEAAQKGARLIIFPESALSFSDKYPATADDLMEAQARINETAASEGVYVLYCVQNVSIDRGGLENDAILADPTGKVIFKQSKLYDNKGNRPGIFYIDGIPCNVAICADRWLRQACDLPVIKESQVLIECSWSGPPDYGKNIKRHELMSSFWRPKVWRLNCFFIRTNCANIMEPDGTIHSGTAEPDNVLVRTIDLAKATRIEAVRRREHPIFKPWWDIGMRMLDGMDYNAPEFTKLLSARTKIKAAAVQMRCGRNMNENLKNILFHIDSAKSEGAHLVVFPELCLTGGITEDILATDNEILSPYLLKLTNAAKQNRIHVIAGLPWVCEDGKRRNTALVISDKGQILTRYYQLAVDRPEVFVPGESAKRLWFQIKGVHAVVTVGHDRLWSEIAELAAVKGAQIIVNISNDNYDAIERELIWENMGSFKTFTIAANAASGSSNTANGHSGIWNSIGYSGMNAVKVAGSGIDETILYAEQDIRETNTWYDDWLMPFESMLPWWKLGARIIHPEAECMDEGI